MKLSFMQIRKQLHIGNFKWFILEAGFFTKHLLSTYYVQDSAVGLILLRKTQHQLSKRQLFRDPTELLSDRGVADSSTGKVDTRKSFCVVFNVDITISKLKDTTKGADVNSYRTSQGTAAVALGTHRQQLFTLA